MMNYDGQRHGNLLALVFVCFFIIFQLGIDNLSSEGMQRLLLLSSHVIYVHALDILGPSTPPVQSVTVVSSPIHQWYNPQRSGSYNPRLVAFTSYVQQ